MSTDRQALYSRHIAIPEIGASGQERFNQARVLVIGAGGLGCPIAQYLCAAGVGELTLMDDDAVELSNIQRQILFGVGDVGLPKAIRAAEKLSEQYSHLNVRGVKGRFDTSNAIEIASKHDLIIDATDNFETKYLANDVAFHLKIPFVFASIFQFEGQVGVYNPDQNDTPINYRDIFPDAPPREVAGSCSEMGVLGVLPGLLGLIQANEALKLIGKYGEPLNNQLMLVDALTLEFTKFNVTPLADNPLRNSSSDELLPFNRGELSRGDNLMVDWSEVKATERSGKTLRLIDVRSREEHARESLGGECIPQAEILDHLDELSDPGVELVLYCQSGVRSFSSTLQLLAHGIEAKSLSGGVDNATGK